MDLWRIQIAGDRAGIFAGETVGALIFKRKRVSFYFFICLHFSYGGLSGPFKLNHKGSDALRACPPSLVNFRCVEKSVVFFLIPLQNPIKIKMEKWITASPLLARKLERTFCTSVALPFFFLPSPHRVRSGIFSRSMYTHYL